MHATLTAQKLRSPADLEALREAVLRRRDPKKPTVAICMGTGCLAYGSEEVLAALEDEIRRQGLDGKVIVRKTGCPGFCERGPLMVVHPEGILYPELSADAIPSIVSETLLNGRVVERFLYTDPVSRAKVVREQDVPFYKRQMRVVLRHNGVIDPTDILDYIAVGGYTALAKVLTSMTPEQVIDEIDRSGLRGRGGAGFPTGRKWRACRQAKGDIKYVICNGDEGDPGAFMDRAIMEGNPHSVLEGMIIGAYAIGANEGYIYVRAEYPLAVRNLRIAIEEAEDYGLLGRNILGSGLDFTVRINRGAGAFVCGESTALVASIEGRIGEPRAKHIHLVESGLWGRPTNLNNVETWANVPVIINQGADWYASIGTAGSKGTKVFSLVGKINNTGLVEVPMGITLREIVYDIGGGVPGRKRLKAVQPGGPSGGCIPESLIDLPVDFDKLTEVGSMMGSGGMIVMDEDTCMVDMARYFLNFLRDESCGKCTACREGIRRMLDLLMDITQGRGRPGDIELLEELAHVVADTSLCQLGATAPNPVLTTIKYFRSEYEAHVNDRKCPAGVCKELVRYSIIEAKCPGCGLCVKECPQGAITGERKKPHHLDASRCIKCGACYEVCRMGAIARN